MGIDSAYTSTKRLPRAFKVFEDLFGNLRNEVNLDYGGGKYEKATEWLAGYAVTNIVYDPYNRSTEHNEAVMNRAIEDGVSCITCLNVLNVVRDENERIAILSNILHIAIESQLVRGEYPVILIQVYEGNKSGTPSVTTAQMNRRATDYYDEIRMLFCEEDWHMTRHGNIFCLSHF